MHDNIKLIIYEIIISKLLRQLQEVNSKGQAIIKEMQSMLKKEKDLHTKKIIGLSISGVSLDYLDNLSDSQLYRYFILHQKTSVIYDNIADFLSDINTVDMSNYRFYYIKI